MPELPEVETVRRGLIPVMEGMRLIRVIQRRPDLRWPLPERFAERLTGRCVARLRRRSKYLLCDLDGGETLIAHLGMSGRMLVQTPEAVDGADREAGYQPHDHVVFEIESGARVVFNDPRRFGSMDLHPTATLDAHPLLARLGPEPLGNAFDGPYLAARLRRRKAPVKTALLDQRIVAGLGNIYVCEALYRAGIAPTRASGSISASRIESLVATIRAVLCEAIEAGGSSLRDYRRADGELGYFQHSFDVYGREGADCRRPGCRGVVKRLVQSGRSSFHCPVCQC